MLAAMVWYCMDEPGQAQHVVWLLAMARERGVVDGVCVRGCMWRHGWCVGWMSGCGSRWVRTMARRVWCGGWTCGAAGT
jgi:hypothetical protein